MESALHRSKIRLFVASPSDVKEERQEVREVIKHLNEDDYNIEPCFWEDLLPDGARPPETDILSKFPPSDWDIFILIMWSKFGTATQDPESGQQFASGTECEYYRAMKEYEKSAGTRPAIRIYQSLRPLPPATSQEDHAQRTKVFSFFETVSKTGHTKTFADIHEFRSTLLKHIRDTVKELRSGRNQGEAIDTDPLGDDLKANYFETFLKFHNNYDPSFKTSTSLSDLYISPNVAGKSTKRQAILSKFLSEQAILDMNLTHILRRPSETFEEIVEDALNTSYRMVLVGDPGIGKTTFLKMLGVEAARTKKKIPVFVRLSQFGLYLQNVHSSTLSSLQRFILENDDSLIAEKFPQLSLPQFIENLENNETFVVLLDALDEINDIDLRKRVVLSINSFIRRFPKTSVIISMRDIEAIFDCPLKELLPLTPESIQSYIEKWLQQYGAKQLSGLAQKIGDDKKLQNLLSNPQMMYMVVRQAFEAEISTSINYSSRAGLYKRFVEHFLYERPSGRDPVNVPNISTVISDLQKDKLLVMRVLGKIAFDIHATQQWYADRVQINKSIQHAVPRYTEAQVGECFRYIVEETGMLVEAGNDNWKFSQFPFQQYLSARFLTEHNGYLYGLAYELSMNLWWQDVIVIYFFLSADQRFLNHIVNDQDNLFYTRLLLAMRCACERANESNSTEDLLGEIAKKLVKVYCITPFLALQNIISSQLSQLPSAWLIKFIKDEFDLAQGDYRLFLINLTGNLQSSDAVHFLSEIYFYRRDLSLVEKNLIIDAYVEMQFADSDVALVTLLSQEKEDVVRGVIRQMLRVNHERYIPKLFQNLVQYPNALDQILSEVGTAENYHQDKYPIVEKTFFEEIKKAKNDSDRRSQLLGWIRFPITDEFAQLLYTWLQDTDPNIKRNVIYLAKYQPNRPELNSQVLALLYDSHTLRPIDFDCIDFLLYKSMQQDNKDIEEYVIGWLESLPHRFTDDDAIYVAKILGANGGEFSLNYLIGQFLAIYEDRSNPQLLDALILATSNIVKLCSIKTAPQRDNFINQSFGRLASMTSNNVEELIHLIMALGRPHQIQDLLDLAISHPVLSSKFIIVANKNNWSAVIPREGQPVFRNVLDSGYKSSDVRVIDSVLDIERNFYPEQLSLSYQQFIDRLLTSSNLLVKIEAIKRFNTDKYRGKVLDILAELANSNKFGIRQESIRLLSEFGDESSIDVLLSFLGDPECRDDAFYALYEIAKRTNHLALASLNLNGTSY